MKKTDTIRWTLQDDGGWATKYKGMLCAISVIDKQWRFVFTPTGAPYAAGVESVVLFKTGGDAMSSCRDTIDLLFA